MALGGDILHYRLGSYEVGRLGYGAMRLTGPGVFGPPRDQHQAIAVLREAVDAGVDHIDTAHFYGPEVANSLIHRALYPYPAGLALVSKVGFRRDEQGRILSWRRPRDLRRGIEENLRSLRVEQLAAVNLRLVDGAPANQFFDDQLAAMIEAQADGLIAGIGLSNITAQHLRRAVGVTDVVCVQNAFHPANLASRDVLEECTRRDIAFVPFASLGSGLPGPGAVLDSPRVTAVARRFGLTAAQVALAWALGQAPNVLVIPGTKSLSHLRENLAVRDLLADASARHELARLGAA